LIFRTDRRTELKVRLGGIHDYVNAPENEHSILETDLFQFANTTFGTDLIYWAVYIDLFSITALEIALRRRTILSSELRFAKFFQSVF